MLRVRCRKRLPYFTLEADIACPAGAILVLTGPSGSGKTTLLRLIAGLDDPDQGRVELGDAVWCDTARGIRLHPRRRNIGLVFQDYSLFPHMTLAANVAYAAADRGEVAGLLGLFGLSHLADARPAAMSGGERQRGALCQALARRPGALLLDEPFSALDAATRLSLRDELLLVRQRFAIPIIHVTHDLAEAARLGDVIVAIKQGRIDTGWFDRQLDLHLEEQRELLARRGGGGPVPFAGTQPAWEQDHHGCGSESPHPNP
ncbi:ATP-binding cassette domain-containing protein [Solidesulfovibrio sp.]